ncbi:MAG: hypothetical protein U0Q55_15925 [Vicinamibacterales bacterium]
MVSRRFLSVVAIISTAVAFFLLGDFHARAGDAADRAEYDAKLDAIRAEVRSQIGHTRRPAVQTAGTSGSAAPAAPEAPATPADAARARLVAEVKQELQSEMGLLPVQLLRERRSSFLELYSNDNQGRTNYGTAGYLGSGAGAALRPHPERGCGASGRPARAHSLSRAGG